MRSLLVAFGTCATLLNAVPAGAQAEQFTRKTSQEDQQPGILLRFQLIAATDTKNVDPAITAIDAVLKDLFRFPGYRLLSQAAVMMEHPGNPRTNATMATQLLSGDGETYKLTVFLDSTTAQTVRMNVSLAAVPRTAGPGSTLFSTSVEVSYGHTVVLGSTQPSNSSAVGRGGAVSQTLILAVRAEGRGQSFVDAPPAPPASGFTDAKVDEAVVVKSCGTPGYPAELRAARITGSVSLRYVVGLDGKVEPASIKVVNSTNKLFEQYAISAILTCTYSPAKIKGVAVRDIVENMVKFVPPQE